MFTNRSFTHRINTFIREIITLCFVCILAVFANPAKASEIVICPQDDFLHAGSVLRTTIAEPDEVRYFQLEIPGPGLVSVDISTRVEWGGKARLGYAGDLCQLSDQSEPLWLERSARHLSFVAQRPGSYFFRVAGQDPSHPPGEIKVITGFRTVADFSKEEDPGVLEIEPDANANGDENPIDDPGGYTTGGNKAEDDGVLEIEPDGNATGGENAEDEGVLEIEPDDKSYFVDEPSMLGWMSSRFCGRSLTDDHGETPGCATRLSIDGRGEVSGEISNAWGDDVDVFAFYVPEVSTLEVSTLGETDTLGSLYDRRGHRLAVDDDGGSERNFRLVETLSPGLYFLEIAGSGSAEGAYQVQIDTMSW